MRVEDLVFDESYPRMAEFRAPSHRLVRVFLNRTGLYDVRIYHPTDRWWELDTLALQAILYELTKESAHS